jgi:hypothetical protein
MPFTDIAPPPAPKPPGTGISFGLSCDKHKRTKVRLTFRADIQQSLFGGPIGGVKFHAKAGRGSDEGRLMLVQAPDGDLEARAGIKGSAYLVMSGWDLLPKDKRPAAPCKIHSTPSNKEVILELPPFCRPSGVGGKMEAEHGLARVGTKRPAQRG